MAASDDRGNERTGTNEAEPEEKTDGWLTTYADMVTLLMTFFVLMFALSSTDEASLELFMLALSREGLTAEQYWEIKDKYDFELMDYDSWDDSFPYLEDGEHEGAESEDQGGAAALHDLHEAMQGYIDQEDLGEVIQLTFNGEFLLMTLASDILFDSGMATLTPDMIESAKVIAGMLAATFNINDPFEIVVAGHTDNVPISTPQYPSNWHLSRDRSINYLWELLHNSELDPGIFYARACGEYRPIASNDTPEGRQMNRRVEVMVSLARDNPLWDRTQGE